MAINEFIERLKQENKAFKSAYEARDLAFDVGNRVLEARIVAGLTQEKLAKKVGTKQPSIARVESGERLPSLSFLERIASALGTELVAPSFASIEERTSQETDSVTVDSITAEPQTLIKSPIRLEYFSLSQ